MAATHQKIGTSGGDHDLGGGGQQAHDAHLGRVATAVKGERDQGTIKLQ
jgi:hypothetical protein